MTKYGEVRVADLVERKDDLIIEPPLAYELDLNSTYLVGDVTVTEVIGLKTVAVENGHVCLDNTTDVPLGIGGVFEGPYQDTLNYNTITIGIVADQDSATDGLVIQWSADGLTVTQTDEFSILANKGKVFTFSPANRYVSVKYTNGAVAQALFNVQTIFKKGGFKASSHRIKDSIVADDDAELTKSVLTAQEPTGTFVNIGASDTGNLKVTDAENGLAIAKGEVVGTDFTHKFGTALDFDTSDGEVTVWDGAEDGEPYTLMQYVYSTTAAIDSISAENAADTQEIAIQGLDANFALVNQAVTLNGQNRVALTTPLIRVFRAFNNNSTNLIGHVFIFENVALTAGVPNDATLIRAVIHPDAQQTEMAVFTIPAGTTGYMRSWYASSAGANKTTNIIVRVKSRADGKVFRLKHRMAWDGAIPYQHEYHEPEVFTEKTDIEMTAELTAVGVTGAAVSSGFDLVLVDN